MVEIGSGNGSSYPASIDTDSTLESASTKARKEVPNDLAAGLIAVQTTLGTTPQGTADSVKDFLQEEHNTDGTHPALVHILYRGTLAALTAAYPPGTAGRYAEVTDTLRGLYKDNGTAWVSVTGYADVRDFGAVGDGTPAGGGTDDTAAFVAAIAAVPQGGTLFIPKAQAGKCYRLTETLVFTKVIRILGEGWQFRQADSWQLDGSVLCQTGAGHIVFDLGNGAVGGELNGFVIDGLAVGGITGTSHAVRQRAVNRSRFRNIYIIGAGDTGWYQDGGTVETQNILNRYEHIVISTAFGTAQGYAKPTTGVSAYSGPNVWSNLHISGIDGGGAVAGLDLDGPVSDGEGSLYENLSIENSTIPIRFGANSISNVFLNPYSEGSGSVSGTVTASNRSNLTIGRTATGLDLPSTVGANIRANNGKLIIDGLPLAAGVPQSPFTTAGTTYGAVHATNTDATAETTSSAIEANVAVLGHTTANVDDVVIGEFIATGALADTDVRIGAGGSFNVGDAALYAYRRSTGVQSVIHIGKFATDVVATASLPAAGAAQDGRALIEDAGAGDRNLIIYAGGQRFRIDGGAPF